MSLKNKQLSPDRLTLSQFYSHIAPHRNCEAASNPLKTSNLQSIPAQDNSSSRETVIQRPTLLAGLNRPPMRILQLPRVHRIDRRKNANLLPAHRHLLLEDQPLHALRARRRS